MNGRVAAVLGVGPGLVAASVVRVLLSPRCWFVRRSYSRIPHRFPVYLAPTLRFAPPHGLLTNE
jgi:hypothetical protein